MGRYLDSLKNTGNGGGTTLQNLQNPLDDSFVGFVGTPPPPFKIIQAANDSEKHGDNLPRFAWLIHFADRDSLPVTFSPEVTRAEALACYPDAVAAEPCAPNRPQPTRAMTADEEAATWAWLAHIGETDPPCIAGVLARCRDDTEARAYYIGRAGEVPNARRIVVARSCRDCRHLARPGRSDGYCAERTDLPKAYGENHPLHELPSDGGASCPKWVSDDWQA